MLVLSPRDLVRAPVGADADPRVGCSFVVATVGRGAALAVGERRRRGPRPRAPAVERVRAQEAAGTAVAPAVLLPDGDQVSPGGRIGGHPRLNLGIGIQQAALLWPAALRREWRRAAELLPQRCGGGGWRHRGQHDQGDGGNPDAARRRTADGAHGTHLASTPGRRSRANTVCARAYAWTEPGPSRLVRAMTVGQPRTGPVAVL